MDGKKTCWVSALRVLWAGLSIPICIASLPAVVFHPMAPAGFPAGLGSFCPCACYSFFPPSVPERSGKSLRLRQAPFLRLTREVQLRYPHEFRCYIAPLYETEWAVYAKPPFAGPQQVLDYVGRYAHRVAISNNRLPDIEHDQVAFQWKDYRHNDRQKKMTLPWRFLWLRLSSRCMNAGHSSFSRKQLVDDRAEGSQRPCSDEALPVDKECRRAGHTIAVGVLNVFGNFIGHLAAFDARVEICRVETADCLRHRGYGGEADSSDPLILKYRSVQSPIFIRSLLKGAVGRLGRFFCIRMHI